MDRLWEYKRALRIFWEVGGENGWQEPFFRVKILTDSWSRVAV